MPATQDPDLLRIKGYKAYRIEMLGLTCERCSWTIYVQSSADLVSHAQEHEWECRLKV